eukprot:1158663-Pelagomonas_calceolata.AAC.7
MYVMNTSRNDPRPGVNAKLCHAHAHREMASGIIKTTREQEQPERQLHSMLDPPQVGAVEERIDSRNKTTRTRAAREKELTAGTRQQEQEQPERQLHSMVDPSQVGAVEERIDSRNKTTRTRAA